MHRHRLVLPHVQREQSAMIHPMHFVPIVPLANQVHQEQHYARPATKESPMANQDTPVKNVPRTPFKIKTPSPVRIATRAPVDSPTRLKEPVFAKTKDMPNPPIATHWNTSMTRQSTKTIGIAFRAPLVLPAVAPSIGPVCKPNLVGPGATTTRLPLHNVLFQRLV